MIFKKPFSLSSWDQVMHLLIKISKLLLIPLSSKSSKFISTNFEVASKFIFFKDLGFNKHNLKLDFTKFNLLQDKIYKIKEGFFTEFVRIFTQLAYIKLIEIKKSFSIFNFNDLIKTVENSFLDSETSNSITLSKIFCLF